MCLSKALPVSLIKYHPRRGGRAWAVGINAPKWGKRGREWMKEMALSLQLAQDVSATQRLFPGRPVPTFPVSHCWQQFLMQPPVYLSVILHAHCAGINNARCSSRNRFTVTQTMSAASRGKRLRKESSPRLPWTQKT